MCLITKQLKPKISTRKTTCYKVIVRKNDGSYVTPFKLAPIGTDVVLGKHPFRAEGKVSVKSCGNGKNLQGKGMVHAYTDYLSATTNAQILLDCILSSPDPCDDEPDPCDDEIESVCVFRCTMPILTRHFSSIDGKELSAKRIVFEDILDSYKTNI